jgi:hypothetical protein
MKKNDIKIGVNLQKFIPKKKKKTQRKGDKRRRQNNVIVWTNQA